MLITRAGIVTRSYAGHFAADRGSTEIDGWEDDAGKSGNRVGYSSESTN